MRKKYWILFLATFAGIACGYAQTTLRGTVRSTQNESLPGVSVYIRGTSTGTFTDATGAFAIALPAGGQDSTLVFSLVGYATSEVAIGSRTQFEVVLADDTKTLSEVVVTGYMVEERQKITGAVNTVTGDLISRLPVPGIDQALQGRAPGVVVSQNTGARERACRYVSAARARSIAATRRCILSTECPQLTSAHCRRKTSRISRY